MTDAPVIGIYSIENCGKCTQAKALLKNKGLEFKEFLVQSSEEREDIKKMFPHAKSFPIVVIDHKWIGGYTQLSEWLRKRNEKP